VRAQPKIFHPPFCLEGKMVGEKFLAERARAMIQADIEHGSIY